MKKIVLGIFILFFMGTSGYCLKEEQSFLIHLQDGFSGEKVVVRINNKIVYEGNPKTDERLGLAQQIIFNEQAGFVTLNIQSPSQGINSTVKIDLRKGKAIGVSISKGKMQIKQANAFGYD